MGIEKYLETIGESGKSSKLEDLYLWHGTPKTDTLQNQIKNSVGARDDDVNNPKSRTYKIHKEMKHLLANAGGVYQSSRHLLRRWDCIIRIKKINPCDGWLWY